MTQRQTTRGRTAVHGQCATPVDSRDQFQFSPVSASSATLSIDIDEHAFSIGGSAEMGVAGVSPPSTRNNSAQSSPRVPAAYVSASRPCRPQSTDVQPQSACVQGRTDGAGQRSGGAKGAGTKGGGAHAKAKRNKESKQGKEAKQSKEAKQGKDAKQGKGNKQGKDSKQGKGAKQGKDRCTRERNIDISASSDMSTGSDVSTAVNSDDYAIEFSQAEWDAEVGGRMELPTGLEKSLTAQILHTYETRLFPSAESIEIKRAFIEKFATMLVTEFPDWEVDIHVFGSSVNGLGTSRSDVDICLTTEHRELENVFVLSRVLRKHGMRTYCVPRARVPIVKIWDPELRMAADINVNNTIALHNTRMLQTFVAADGRVRPFVMAIKNWTKSREINDAAFGGTLSSYAWAILAIHFLQTRQPPIVPVLHPPAKSLRADECAGVVDLSFDDDITGLREFGRANTESLGHLLYAFFRTYAYEFDYRHQVVSLRNGCYLDKAQKGWDSGRPAGIFCIEEPFSTWLNLAHSANTTAVEGIRQEFQRAFCILRDGGAYDQVCEVYQRPPSMAQDYVPMSAPVRNEYEVPPAPTRTHSEYEVTQSRTRSDYAATPALAYPITPSLSASSTIVDSEFSSSYSAGLVQSPYGAYHSTTALPRVSRRESCDSGVRYGSTHGARQWYAAPSHVAHHAFAAPDKLSDLSELDEQMTLRSQFARMAVTAFKN